MNPQSGTVSGSGNASSAQYLESIVTTASPAKLRLMLIERAVSVSEMLENTWRENPGQGPNEHSLKLLELLTELLRGVVGSKQGDGEEVCKQVSDLYVFLLKHLVAAEEMSDTASIAEIRAVLQVEAETWRLACVNELGTDSVGAGNPNTGTGLNLEA